MTYASILAAVSGAPDDASAVAFAAELASRQAAMLRVLTVLPTVDIGAAAFGIGPMALSGAVMEALVEARADMQRRACALVAKEVSRFGLPSAAGTSAMVVDAPSVWLGLAGQLPLTDLVVVGQSAAKDGGPWTGVLADALMAARAPIFIARGDLPPFGRPAAIAWDGSLEAGRAVKAAIPLLKDASEVTILQDPDGLESSSSDSNAPDRLIEYLGHYGVGPITVIKLKGKDEGLTLLRAAVTADAAMLVAGAFGHARVREAVFGGATRTFLRDDNGPHLFLSH
jgi:nucleotide-binding universal stress UspA family protein